MRQSRWIWACLLLLSFVPSGLSGQSVHGRLLDADTEQPIASATVTLLDLDGALVAGVLTDDRGAFVLEAPGTGRYQLRGERIGYQASVSLPLDMFRGDTVEVELRLSTQAVLLSPLLVTVSPRPNLRNHALDGFYERHSRGRGRFFTPSDIERMRPAFVTNLLQMSPGIYMRYPRGPGQSPLPLMRSGTRDCLPTLFVDGHRVPLAADIGIDTWVTGSQIRALEVYRSSMDVPAEFQSFTTCGAIVAWTEHGLGLARYDQVTQSRSRRLLYSIAMAATMTVLSLVIAGR